MYIIIAVMGSCLTGARATSQAFLTLRVSVSSVVGGARTAVLEETCFCRFLANGHECEEEGRCTLFPEVAVNPGGSGIPADFGFV